MTTTNTPQTTFRRAALSAIAALVALLALSQPALAAETATPARSSGEAGARVIGGYYPHATQWPWMASIQNRNAGGNDYNRHSCGGTLIHARLVVTAAHCVTNQGSTYPASRFQVVLGKRRLSAAGGEHINVSRVEVHQSYNSPKLSHDVALLYLASPSRQTPAQLVDPRMSVYQGNMVTSMGWGLVRGGGDWNTEHSDNLKAVDLAIWSDANCQAAGQTTQDQQWYRNNFHGPTNICAGFTDSTHTTCNGDSGGPMMISVGGQWRLLGLVSWGGINCPGQWSPTVFTWMQGSAIYGMVNRGIAAAARMGSAPASTPVRPGGTTTPTRSIRIRAGLKKLRVRRGRRMKLIVRSNRSGRASIKVVRKGRRIGTWSARVRKGRTVLRMPTRIGRRKFRRGSYRLGVSVRSGAARSNRVVLGFRVI